MSLTIDRQSIEEMVRYLNTGQKYTGMPKGIASTHCIAEKAGHCPFKDQKRPLCGKCRHLRETVQFITDKTSSDLEQVDSPDDRPGGKYLIKGWYGHNVELVQGSRRHKDWGTFEAKFVKGPTVSDDLERELSRNLREHRRVAQTGMDESAARTASEQRPYVNLRKHGRRGGVTAATPEEQNKIFPEIKRK